MKGTACKQNFWNEGVLDRVASENTYRDSPGDPWCSISIVDPVYRRGGFW